ncbi:MAG: hypothetical protein AAFN77_07145 [Planctomycetota bacterium]
MNRLVFNLVLITAVVFSIAGTLSAQDAVFIYKPDGKPGKVNGRITSADPEGVLIDGNKVLAATIRKISIGREPATLDRARDQFEAGQFADCIEQLNKLNPVPSQPLLVADIDFMKAYSAAQISLRGGNVTPKAAGQQIQGFLTTHPNSFHKYPAIERYGQLIFAFGRPELAASEFKKLQSAEWTEYRLKGHFFYAKMMEVNGNSTEAITSYDTILKESGTDDKTQTYRLLANIEKTKLSGLNGDAAAAIQSLNQLVGEQDAENEVLFGHLNNALGALYEKSGNLKAARMAYLKTQLLYSAAEGPHAEALYRLAQIWPQLQENDRANDAREVLRSQYRNSYWTSKL